MIKGECSCGAVKFELKPPLRNVVWCHCSKCQHWHGGPGPYTTCEKSAVSFQNDVGLTWWRVAKTVERGFCRVCGSSLFYADSNETTWSIAAGSLNSPTGLKTSMHIFVKSKPDWYELGDDGVPRKDAY
ncbi:MAG: GFA family protein [Archangium sp.]